MLDNNIGDVIDQVIPFVTDAIWIGKANHLRSRLALNGENDPVTTQKAKELMEWQTDKNQRSGLSVGSGVRDLHKWTHWLRGDAHRSEWLRSM